LPKVARFMLAFGQRQGHPGQPRDVCAHTVSLASSAVPRDSQLPPSSFGRPVGIVPAGPGGNPAAVPTLPAAPGRPGNQ
jgi:hypothetical protein